MISHGPLNESPAILSAGLSLGPPHLAYRLYCAVSTVEKIGVGIATSLPGICQSYRQIERQLALLRTRDIYIAHGGDPPIASLWCNHRDPGRVSIM